MQSGSLNELRKSESSLNRIDFEHRACEAFFCTCQDAVPFRVSRDVVESQIFFAASGHAEALPFLVHHAVIKAQSAIK